MDIEQRTQAIRAATPNCVENLFEMQNKICDLCNQPIQDLILAHLDHSIPVIRYARALDVAVEDAIRECNRLDNLKVVHSRCNRIKSFRTREEWFQLGLDQKVGKVKFISDSKLARAKFVASIGGKIGGKKTGPKSQKEKFGIFALTFEQKKEIGRQNGQRNIDSGHMSRVGKERGPIQGRINIENGQIFTLPHIRWHVKRNVVNPDCKLCKVN